MAPKILTKTKIVKFYVGEMLKKKLKEKNRLFEKKKIIVVYRKSYSRARCNYMQNNCGMRAYAV